MRLPLFLSVALRFLRHERYGARGRRLARLTLRLWSAGRLGREPSPRRVAVTVPGGTLEAWVWGYLDLLVLRELVLDEDYRFPPGLRPRRILDLGANTGLAALLLRARFPEAEIVAVEPDPRTAARLRVNVAATGIRVVEAAVCAAPGRVTFFCAGAHWASGLADPGGAAPVEVAAVTVADLAPDGADLVKLDIEGGEWPLLAAGAVQAAAACVVGELHLGDGRAVADARAAFDGWDFTLHEQRGPVATFTARRRAPARGPALGAADAAVS